MPPCYGFVSLTELEFWQVISIKVFETPQDACKIIFTLRTDFVIDIRGIEQRLFHDAPYSISVNIY